VGYRANQKTGLTIHEHLAWWGLRHFKADADYFAWQQHQLFPSELNRLRIDAERKRLGDRRDEIAFYDLTAQPRILPVLYSQRYEYYQAVGERIIASVGEAKQVLDFGCGVGILTTLYARRLPDTNFIGIDRSPASIALAQQKAKELGLANVRFNCMDTEIDPIPGSYDFILATHALLQAEQEPGIPSQSWKTFIRAQDRGQQASFEQRTGLGVRLDRLCSVLDPTGRMVVFEKARQLARVVPLQRALAARGLQPVMPPVPIRYCVIEEGTDDGPFYLLQQRDAASAVSVAWNESPESDEGIPFDSTRCERMRGDSDRPLYENHWPSAQRVWEQLAERELVKESTRQGPDGRQMHVEIGRSKGLLYLYCANTFDQRQLVIIEPARASMLESYYQEIVEDR
jgi:tRNA G46 methylase TrmB